ncbi:heat shock protein 9/12-domain-containing protein [Phellopilus nigrolimitatus]|nr:heat shock protein 9/12-domain-containing protein [Phellopilus nigrolimitatus]
MSDNNRWGFTDRAEAKLKPDSEKSTTEHVGDKFKGKGDNVASSAQPQNEKSYPQKIGDTVTSNSNENDRSLLDKTKDTIGLGENKQ